MLGYVLANCEGPITEEHYLSHGIIGSDDVVVSGLPFLRGETRVIPGAKLTRNMLCLRHNGALSPVDSAATYFFRVIKTFKERAFMRARGARKRGGIDTYSVDGALVERWALKTLVNVMFDRELESGKRWRPEERWVRC